MTTSALHRSTTPVGAPATRRHPLLDAARTAWQVRSSERRAVRAFRAQERAFGDLCGAERSDALALARRAA